MKKCDEELSSRRRVKLHPVRSSSVGKKKDSPRFAVPNQKVSPTRIKLGEMFNTPAAPLPKVSQTRSSLPPKLSTTDKKKKSSG